MMASTEYALVFAEPAISDISEASEYLELEVPGLARRFVIAIQSTGAAIISAPQAYPIVAFGAGTTAPVPGLRNRPVQPPFDRYLLFYRLVEEKKQVEVTRVLHGARNLSVLLGLV